MVVKVHEGGETEPGVGQLPDEGRSLGERLLLVLGHSPLVAELGGVGTKADDSEG